MKQVCRGGDGRPRDNERMDPAAPVQTAVPGAPPAAIQPVLAPATPTQAVTPPPPITPHTNTDASSPELQQTDSSIDSRLNSSSSSLHSHSDTPAAHNISPSPSPDTAGPSGINQPTLAPAVPISSLDQNRNPKKNDIIFYLDTESNTWLRVLLFQKSRYKYYWNIRYIDSDREDAGLYLISGQQWSFTLPNLALSPSTDTSTGSSNAAQVEQERVPVRPASRQVSPVRPASRQVSPVETAHRQETLTQHIQPLHPLQHIRAGRVYRLTDGSLHGTEAVAAAPVCPATPVCPRVRKRAEKLKLHPSQEFMRMSIAKTLTIKKKGRASAFLDWVLNR